MNTAVMSENNKKELPDQQLLKSYFKKGGELIIKLPARVL